MVAPVRWLSLAAALFALTCSAQTPEPSPSAAAASTPRPEQITWSQVRLKEPYIAMTFDDGPHATLTPKLLDMLKERGIHATFFVVGENAHAHPELLKRALAEGHEIGNHSWNHPNLAKMSRADVESQLNRTKDAIIAATGKTPDLMRPPYGSLSAEQRKWVHSDLGYKIILWDVDPLDWKDPGPDAVHQRIVKETHHGSIVLSHDIHAGTVTAMPATLDELAGKGFKFVTVSELLAMELPPEAMPKPSPKPGKKPANALPPGVPDKISGAPGQ